MFILDCEQTDDSFLKVTESAFRHLGLSGDAIVELVFVSEEEIKQLNAQTRGIDKVTDVLSYPFLTDWKEFNKHNYPDDYDYEVKGVRLGCIAICSSVAEMQAREYGHSVEREKSYLFLHVLLHLMGYDHIEEGDRVKMRQTEEEILNDIGVIR